MPSKPRLGQNFLVDAHAIQRIVASLGDIANKTVIEIGPGGGAITSALASRAGHVVAVELDSGLAGHLRSQFSSERVTILSEDILNFDFARASESAGHPLIVVGNLPYYMTSPILLKLASGYASLDRALLMVQREVADRVTSDPGSRDYGLLSVTVQMYGPAEKLFTLPPDSFLRRPKFIPLYSVGASFLDSQTRSRREKLSAFRAQSVCTETQDAN